MVTPVLFPTPMRGSLFCGVALLLVASIATAAAPQWGTWGTHHNFQSTQNVYSAPLTTAPHREPPRQDEPIPFPSGPYHPLPLAGNAEAFPPARYSGTQQQRPASSAFAPQGLSLDDLPVDAESTEAVPRGAPAGQGAARGKKQKSSLFKVFSDFFRKPALHKVLLLIGVLLGAWLLSGIIAKIVTMVLSGFVFFKLLQLIEEKQQSSP